MAAIGVIFLWHHPVWGILVACAFGIFHIEDLRRFYVRRNWLALTLRPIAILLISAPVAGMIWLAIRTHSDPREYQVASIVVLLFAPASLFFVILSRYFPNSRLFKFLEHGIEGIRITGVF
ncbi:MAG: hypothetical protein HKN33_16395 [Pyrinomonadaceae bacterium]|nr:hypothetical protein [Pyrinomonadaceae bacterium]